MRKIFFVIVCAIFLSQNLVAQVVVPFTPRFQVTQKGGIVFLANVSVSCAANPASAGGTCQSGTAQVPPSGNYIDNNYNAVYVDIDGSASTFQSSSDSMNLANCSNVTWAGLYWGANGASTQSNANIKIKVNNGGYQSISADQKLNNTAGYTSYHNYKNITSIVKAAGRKARFTLADIPNNSIGSSNIWGSWMIAVVYNNDLESMKQLTVFDGLASVSGANVNVSLSGFLTPPTGPVDFELGAYVHDGDRGNTGDRMQWFSTSNTYIDITDGLNPANDIMNSTVSNNGVVTPYRIPNLNNPAGLDADIFGPNNTSKNYLTNSQTSASFRLTTSGDIYLAQVLTTAIDVFEPDIRVDKKVFDKNGNNAYMATANPGDTLTYKITYKNIGSDTSINSFITDTIDQNATYVPNSMSILVGPNSGTKTDASGDDQASYSAGTNSLRFNVGTGATSSSGGKVNFSPPGADSTVVQFKVRVSDNCYVLKCDDVVQNTAYGTFTGKISNNTYTVGSNPAAFDNAGCPINGSTDTYVNVAYIPCTYPSDTNVTFCYNNIPTFASFYTTSGYTLFTDASFATVTSPSATGTYYAIKTTYTDCTDTVQLNVTINTTTANAGSNQSLNCTTTSVVIGSAAVIGSTYSWSPATGLSAMNIAQPTASPSTTTTYTVTVTGSNGCTATSTVTVTLTSVPASANAGSNQTNTCSSPTSVIGTASVAGNTYIWSPASGLSATNVAQPTANPSSATTYTVTVTNTSGCTATSTVLVTVNKIAPTANAGSTQNLNCTSTSATIGTANVMGNTYFWGPTTGLNATNIAQPMANPSSTTTYTITVTGSNGCTATSTVTVNVNTTAPAANAGSNTTNTCSSPTSVIGTALIVGSTYSWSAATGLSATNIAQPTANPTSSTNYTVTVTGSNGCTATSSVTVNVNKTAPTANAGSTQNLNCTTTSATLGSASVLGNSYSWSPATALNATNIAQPIANPSSTTTYTVTVTGSNGCTATSSVTVNVNTSSPVANAGSTQNLTCTNASATIGSTYVAGYLYSWTPAMGLNATNIAQPIANPTSTTTYTVAVTGSNGCTATSSVLINVNTTPPTANAGSTKFLNCTTTSALIATAAIAGNSYFWCAATGLSATNVAQPTASPASTTTYTVTVTGSNGCTASSSVVVNVDSDVPTADAGLMKFVDCTSPSTTIGTASIIGNSYSWSPATNLNASSIAQPTATPASTTSYTVTVTGSNGCTATGSVTVNANKTSPTANAGSPQFLNCTTTSTTIGTSAIMGYSYSWSLGTGLNATNLAQPTASPSVTTTYTVMVTGSNGCTATSTVTVNVNTTAPTANAGSSQTVNCSSTSALLGSASVPGYTYSWSPGLGLNATNIAQPTASPTSTTQYTVSVTASNGCTATSTVTVSVNNSPPIANAGSPQNLNCTTTSATIGSPNIVGNSYSWSPATGLNAANIAQPIANPAYTTTYTVTVTGSNGCTATSTVTVNVNTTAPTANAGVTLNLNCSITSGTIGTSAIVGNSYVWSPATGLSATNLAQPVSSATSTITYTVTVTGSNGCTATSTVNVVVDSVPPTADAGPAKNLNCTTSSATIGTAAIAGNTYSWSPATNLSATNIAQPVASPTTNTFYTVTVTGTNGCTATSTVSVNINTTFPVADAGPTRNLSCLSTSAVIGTSAIIGNTYSWSPATALNATNMAQPTANPTTTTIYTVTVTGSNSCVATSTVIVNYNTPFSKPEILAYPNNQFCLGTNIQLKATVDPSTTLTWTKPLSCSATIDNSIIGISTLSIQDLDVSCNGTFILTCSISGCTETTSDTIVIDAGVKPTFNYVTTICNSGIGEITVNSTPSVNMEYSVNGAAFQSSNIMNVIAGSNFVLGIRQQNSSCVSYYSGLCVYCPGGTCTAKPKDSLIVTPLACRTTPINIENYMINASTVNFTTSGTGTFSTTTCSTSPCNINYTASEQDVLNGYVIITATTDDPDGVGGCQAGVTSKYIQLINGLVAPTVSTNSPVCENSPLYFTHNSYVGNSSWLGANGYSSTQKTDTILNTPAAMQGALNVTLSASGCTSVTGTKNVVVIAQPNLNVVVTPHAEECAGTGNGRIEVSVSGGSGSYKICYNGNLSNCVNTAYANFTSIAPNNYTVTIIDNSCPANVFGYPTVVNAGSIVTPPIVASGDTVCQGQDLILSGTSTGTILWTLPNSSFNIFNNTLTRLNAQPYMSGVYLAKTMLGSCASLPVYVNVVVHPLPDIQTNAICNGSNGEVTITTTHTDVSYSLNGITYQSGHVFTGLSQGNYTGYVKDNVTGCIATEIFYVTNCACPLESVITTTSFILSCGSTPVSLSAAFTNSVTATWSTLGSGNFSVTSGSSPLATIYTPSLADITAGDVTLKITTPDPDGAGPCSEVERLVTLKILSSLPIPSITTNANSYCIGDALVLDANVTVPVIWSGPHGFSSLNIITTVNPVTTLNSGIYTVTVSGNGCVSQSATTNITVQGAPSLTVTPVVVNESCEGNSDGKVTINVSGGSGRYSICSDSAFNCYTVSNSKLFDWLAPNNYTFYISDTACPHAYQTAPVTVLPGLHVTPPLSASSNSPVCEGDDLILTASGNNALDYLWTDMTNNFTAFGQQITRSPAESGMSGYYKVVQVDHGCPSLPIQIVVDVYETPEILAIDTTCNGEYDGKIVITSSAPPSQVLEYALNDGSYQSSPIFDHLNNGLYLIKARTVGGYCEVIVRDVNLYCGCYCNKDAVVSVYPNPSSGMFTLNARLIVPEQNISVNVYNLSGNQIYQSSLSAKNNQVTHEIDIKQFAAGTYILKLHIGTDSFMIPLNVVR